MTENKNVELVEVPELTQRDKVETYFRSTFLLGSFNFERMQSIGFAVSMIPAIKRFYTKKEDQAEALTRHLEFFNTQPWVASSIMGVTAGEVRAADPDTTHQHRLFMRRLFMRWLPADIRHGGHAFFGH